MDIVHYAISYVQTDGNNPKLIFLVDAPISSQLLERDCQSLLQISRKHGISRHFGSCLTVSA